MSISPTASLLSLWAVWLAAWFLAARSTARTVTRQPWSLRLTHSVPIWAGALLLFLQPRRVGVLLRPLWPANAWIAWAGVGLVAVGLGFAGWARVHLGRFWSSTVTLKAEHALIRTGPYALTRHPIYTGILIALAGTVLVRGTGAALAGFLLLLTGFLLRIRDEERLLLGHFGAAYRTYQEEVPALVPRLRSGNM